MTSVEPNRVRAGEIVTIRGTNLASAEAAAGTGPHAGLANDVSVLIGATPVPVVSITHSEIQARVPVRTPPSGTPTASGSSPALLRA